MIPRLDEPVARLFARSSPALAIILVLLWCPPLAAQRLEALSPEVRAFVRPGAPKVVLAHVEVIDGTGAPAVNDRNLVIENGKVTAIVPGIVGMHEHLFYLAFPAVRSDFGFERPALFHQMSFSAPRLFLANGVTTARTAGSASPYTDLRLKQSIEAGVLPGPHLDVTGPYLEGGSPADNRNLQFYQLTGPDDARETVAFWADRGMTSFKAYKHITRQELRAAVEEAHKRGLKVTGHLCSVTYLEAAEIGIDNLEPVSYTHLTLPTILLV